MNKLIIMLIFTFPCSIMAQTYVLYDCTDVGMNGSVYEIEIIEKNQQYFWGLFESNSKKIEFVTPRRKILFPFDKEEREYMVLKGEHQKMYTLTSSVTNNGYIFTEDLRASNCLGTLMENVQNGISTWEIDMNELLLHYTFKPSTESLAKAAKNVKCKIKEK